MQLLFVHGHFCWRLLVCYSAAYRLCQRVLVAHRWIPDDAHFVDRLMTFIGDNLLLLWRWLKLVMRASGVR